MVEKVIALSHFHAEVEQCVDFVGFVKNGIHTQFFAALADIQGSVVTQNNHALVGLPFLACRYHAQPTALAQKQINNGQVPIVGRLCQPCGSFVFSLSETHWLDIRQLKQGLNKIFTNRGIVFHEKGSKSHGRKSVEKRGNQKDY